MNAAPAASIVPDVSDQPSGAPGENVLSVNGLDVVARTDAGDTPLVEGLTFDLRRGETLCIAGESGSGKSITSLAIMGLLPQPAVRISGGSILFGGRDLATLDEAAMRRIRGDRIAMIFQEPMTSLNPVLSIGRQLIEAIEAHTSLPRGAARERAIEALDAVRIPQARTRTTTSSRPAEGFLNLLIVNVL